MTSPARLATKLPRIDVLPTVTLRTSPTDMPRLLLLAWGALLFNVLTPAGSGLLPIPYSANQALAQGSLLLALVLALLVNPRMVVRPNVFLVLLSVMAVMALVVGLHAPFPVGSTYRALRLTGFTLCLWLLTPWWGRRDLMLLRVHRLCLWAAVASVVVGVVLAPGKAFGDGTGRLSGVLWPMPATQVAHYAAVLLGTSVILWMCRAITGRHAAVACMVTVAVLIGTHTRTALLGALVGLLIASASLFLGHARVRRASASSLVVGALGGTVFAPAIVSWAARGQTAEQASQLTGRTEVWSASVQEARPRMRELFGNGLSNKSFDGLAVDSNWIATYLDLGWFGIAVQVTFFLVLVVMAITHVRGPRRAVALFLISYCIVASVTEVGTADASTYYLDLVVAAALLVPEGRDAR